MAEYGSFPGVKVTTSGGGISGVQVGEEEMLVVFAPGGDGSASVNSVEKIYALSDADGLFGPGSAVANALKTAIANGANREYLRGVQVEEVSVSDEALGTAGDHSSGNKIANTPLVEDTSKITFTDVSGADDLSVEFKYETNTDNTTTDFTSLVPDADTVYINPLTGEWVADASSDYEIDYEYQDYASAIDAADSVLREGQTGVYAVCTEAPSVHNKVEEAIDELRSNFQMVQAVVGARPNKTQTVGSSPVPDYEASSYTDNTSHDRVYVVAPGRQAGGESLVPAIGGLMAGHSITDPIYNDLLRNIGGLDTKLTHTDALQLREADVIPLRDAGGGDTNQVRVKSNKSSAFSAEADWPRDFWRRRIVDRVILIGKEIGDDTIGRINDETTRENARTLIYGELREMVRQRLLKPNENDEVNWIVEVTSGDDSSMVKVDIGITPIGVVKRIDQTITINT